MESRLYRVFIFIAGYVFLRFKQEMVQCRINPTLAIPSLVLFHLAFVKKQFRSYGYATFFCLGKIKNNCDLNDTVVLTRH